MIARPATVAHPGLLERLMEVVKLEFRAEVFRPDPDDPVFTYGRCRVPVCQRPLDYAEPGLCPTHQTGWRRAGRPPVKEWAPHQDQGERNNITFPACLVEGCNRAGGQVGLCARHRVPWSQAGRPDPAEWAANTSYTPSQRGESPCRFTGCERGADVKAGFCSGHYARWKTAGRPADLDSFVRYATGRGTPMLDMRGLPQQVRLELGLGLQRRAEAGDRKTCLKAVSKALTWIRETQVISLLDLDDAAWRQQALGPSGKRATNSALTFVVDTRYHLEVLLAGGVWEREYDRDTWDLRRFARAPENTARYLRFTAIPQPWLRELAKRWARRMISTNTPSGSLADKVRYLGEFAQFAVRQPGGCREPDQLTRPVLEAWFAWMQAENIHVATRRHKISGVSVFLDTIHRLGWEERLPRTAMVLTGDAPPPPPSKPRFLNEVIMRQCEDDANLARFPTRYGELVLRIVMACGLRSKDASWLPFDCVVRDNGGAPYLAWVNHKVGQRIAFFPITEKLVTLITKQQDRVRARFPAGCALLFPAETDNPRGDKPMPRKTWVGHLTAWLADIDMVDEHGHRVHITPHQFRHTLGTRLINANVPQHVVQELLDHMSAAMTAVYARLHDKTVREHWERARHRQRPGRDRPGHRRRPAEQRSLDPGEPRTRQTDPAQRLLRPSPGQGLRACQPCLTCPMFLTTPEFLPQHREQRQRTLTIIESAKAAGHERIVEKNTRILTNLDQIIATCDNCDDGEVVFGGKVTQLDDAS